MKRRLLFYIILPFLGAVASASLFHNLEKFLILLGVSLLVSCFVTASLGLIFRVRKKFMVIPIIVCSLALGFIRFYLDLSNDNDPTLHSLIGETVSIEGIVSDDPDRRPRYTSLVIQAERLIHTDGDVSLDTKILVRANRYPEFSYGDRVHVLGTLEQPENFVGDTGRSFDYVNYLGKDGIFYSIGFGSVEYVSGGHGSPVKRWMLSFKRSLIRSINRTHDQPQGGLLSGILLGEKSALGGNLEDDFRTTGVIHIVVLSGYNVTLVADAIVRVCSFISVRAGMFLGSIGIVLFAIITGGGATVVRASVMALLVILGKHAGREYDVIRGLWFAAFVMVLMNPKILLFDTSFQLSFLATYGLIEVVPLIEKYFHWIPEKFQMRSNLVSTIATQIFVLPLLLYAIGDLSIISPIVNVLILIIIPFAMLVGFIAAVIGWISPLIALPISFVSHADLSYVLKIVELFAGIPFAKIAIPAFPAWVMVVGYIVLIAWIVRSKNAKVAT